MTDNRYADALARWVEYCRAFGMDPNSLIGRRFPGYEEHPVDAKMANAILSELQEAAE